MADTRAIIAPVATATTSGIIATATALASNKARGAWMIQNLGTNPLFVKLGAGASTSSFNVILKGSTVANDGTGGTFAMESGVVYTGIVTIDGTSPSYVATEVYPI